MQTSDIPSGFPFPLKFEFPSFSYPLLPIHHENLPLYADINSYFTKSENLDQELKQESTLSPVSKKIFKKKSLESQSSAETAKARKVRNLWKPYEDALLLELVAKHGTKWTFIGKMIGGRACKQVRDRYNNHLRPNINNAPFTAQEDELLVSLYHQYGSKWCTISKEMPQRTEAQVKNRFYLYLKDKVAKNKSNPLAILKRESSGSQSTNTSEFSPVSVECLLKVDNGFGFISYNQQDY